MRLFRRKGFFLCELMVYLVLLLLMVFLLGQWIGMVFRATHLSISNTIAMQDVIAMQNLLKIDMLHAPAELHRWHYTHVLLRWMQYDGKSIEWSIENGLCVRKEGLYNNDTDEWLTVQKNILSGDNVKGEFHVSIDRKSYVQKIDFIFQSSLQAYSFTYYF